MQHGFIGPLKKVLALGSLVALAGAVSVAVAPWIDLEQDFGLPWLYEARGSIPAPDDVLIVAIDETAAETLGVAPNPRDWPRSLHAELVRSLAHAGARLIAFDLTFDLPSVQPENDAALVAAAADAGNVIATDSVRKDTQDLQDPTGRPMASVVIEKTSPPIPLIAQALLGHAPFLLPKTARVDAYWTFRDGDVDAPTLPVLALRSWAGEHAASPAVTPLAAAQRERIARSLARLRAEGDTAYLNLYGPPRTLRSVPYAQVLQGARGQAGPAGAIAANMFRGKAVFIGYSALTPAGQDRLRDDHRTVFTQSDGLNTSGVELAATAFANLLEDRPLRPMALRWQLAVVVAWGLLLALIGTVLRPAAALAVAGALALLWLWLVLDRFTQQAWWWPSIVPVGVQLPLALFAGVWLHDRQTQRERESIRRAFGYYLPSSFVDQLAHNNGSMTHGNRVAFGSCLSSDVSKYTTLAEQMDPASLARLLNEYYAELFVPVERTGGVVVDVVGDAMVAIWIATDSNEQVRRSACVAALQIVAALDRFNRAPKDRPTLETRFGLDCGELLIGNVGASQHYEYRAVGDSINTASRLQGLNKVLGTRLLASAATVEGLDGLLTRPLGSFRLAGKARDVPVVELIAFEASAAAADQALCRRFSQAIDHYAAGQWPEATDAFAQILSEWPADGPSLFYRQRCEALRADPPGAGWDPCIPVDAK